MFILYLRVLHVVLHGEMFEGMTLLLFIIPILVIAGNSATAFESSGLVLLAGGCKLIAVCSEPVP